MPSQIFLWTLLLAVPLVAAAQQAEAVSPPLRMDVDAAVRSVESARPPADVRLSPLIVHGKRSVADALPCIGCDGRQLLPLKRLQDFSDIVGALLVSHPPSRPDSPEDSALALAHEQSCIDGGFGCLVPK
jgi:hypothetical protein